MSHVRGGEKRPDRADKVLPKAEEGGKKRTAAELFLLSKWRYPPRESTSLRWRASRRSAAERFVIVHVHLFSLFISSLFVGKI